MHTKICYGIKITYLDLLPNIRMKDEIAIFFLLTFIYLFFIFLNMPYPGLLGHRAMPYRGIYRRGATHTYGIPGPTQATGL